MTNDVQVLGEQTFVLSLLGYQYSLMGLLKRLEAVERTHHWMFCTLIPIAIIVVVPLSRTTIH